MNFELNVDNLIITQRSIPMGTAYATWTGVGTVGL